MGDFDWYGTCAAVHAVSGRAPTPCARRPSGLHAFRAPAAPCPPTPRARSAAPPTLRTLPLSPPLPPTRPLPQTGHCTDVMAGDTQGNFLGSYPYAEDGNYKFFLYTDPYKATVSKSTGEDAEEDVYEAYYLGLLLQGKRAEIPDGHVIRVCGEKYMHLRVRVGGEAVVPGNCVVQPVPGLPLLLAARCGTAGLLSAPQPSSPSSAPTTLHHCAPPAAGPGQRDVPRTDQGRGRQRDGLPRDHPRGARHEEGQHAALHGEQGRVLFYCALRVLRARAPRCAPCPLFVARCLRSPHARAPPPFPRARAGQEPEQGHGGLWRRRAGSNGDWVLLHVRRRRAVKGPWAGGGAAPRGGAVAGHGQQGQRALGLGAAILGGVDDTRRARFHPAQLLFPSEALPTRLPRRLKRIKGDLPSVERSVHRRASAFVPEGCPRGPTSPRRARRAGRGACRGCLAELPLACARLRRAPPAQPAAPARCRRHEPRGVGLAGGEVRPPARPH